MTDRRSLAAGKVTEQGLSGSRWQEGWAEFTCTHVHTHAHTRMHTHRHYELEAEQASGEASSAAFLRGPVSPRVTADGKNT